MVLGLRDARGLERRRHQAAQQPRRGPQLADDAPPRKLINGL
ncbi:hypothetical protein ACU686_05290 [Yinghuangia aomiensis]